MAEERLEAILEGMRLIYPTFKLKPLATEYARHGASPFKVLISTVLSLRTKDPVTLEATERLWQKATTPKAMLELKTEELEKLIYPVGFYRKKAEQIKAISEILLTKYKGNVPNTSNELSKLPGVGLKTANLVAGVSFGEPAICVDTHVHRISNRLDLIQTETPAQSEVELKKVIPKKNWIELNDIMVAYGQNICAPVSPKCDSECVIRKFCPQRGVRKHR